MPGLTKSLFAGLVIIGIATFNAGAIADELDQQMKDWKGQAFLCPADGAPFPSKFGQTDLSHCDDGDMTLFNGLICASGDGDSGAGDSHNRGCDAVHRSQGPDGRWWRSPRRIEIEAPKSDVSFSPDQALGVISYVIATNDSDAFFKWVDWIIKNRSKLAEQQVKKLLEKQLEKLKWPDLLVDFAIKKIVEVLPERLSYCTDDIDARCTLRPADCAWLEEVNHHFGRNINVCENYLLYDKMKEAIANTNLHLPDVFALGVSNPVSALDVSVWGGAYFNSEDFPLHLNGAQIYILQKLGHSSEPLIVNAADQLNAREPKNAFFAFLAGKKSGPGSALELLGNCPKIGEPTTDRTQWAWERPDGQAAWKHSMYWDCIFVANLLHNDH